MSPFPKVVTVTLNPAIDQTVYIDGFQPGAVNRVGLVRQNAGGKGVNVASALADLQVPTLATGLLGRENAGLFEELFRTKGIEDRFVRLDGSTRPGLKVVDSSSHQVTEINYPGIQPDPSSLDEVLSMLRAQAGPGTWFVLSGSIPSGVPAEIYGRMIREIRERGGRVLLDTSGLPLRLALDQVPEILKPNQTELEQLTGRTLGSLDEVAQAATELVERGVGLVVVSMGSRGALFASRDESLVALPPKVEVRSTVGAGDAMVASLVFARLRGLGLSDTARFATACGTHAVTRIESGVDPSALRELERQVLVEELRVC
jgi:1-phosphofructokinase